MENVNHASSDCWHFTFFLRKSVSLRATWISNFWKCCSGECQVRFRIAIQIWCNVNQLQDLWESRCLAGELLQILPALKRACLTPLRVLALDMCGQQRYLVTLSIFGSKGFGIFKLLLLGLLCVHAYTYGDRCFQNATIRTCRQTPDGSTLPWARNLRILARAFFFLSLFCIVHQACTLN